MYVYPATEKAKQDKYEWNVKRNVSRNNERKQRLRNLQKKRDQRLAGETGAGNSQATMPKSGKI